MSMYNVNITFTYIYWEHEVLEQTKNSKCRLLWLFTFPHHYAKKKRDKQTGADVFWTVVTIVGRSYTPDIELLDWNHSNVVYCVSFVGKIK